MATIAEYEAAVRAAEEADQNLAEAKDRLRRLATDPELAQLLASEAFRGSTEGVPERVTDAGVLPQA